MSIRVDSSAYLNFLSHFVLTVLLLSFYNLLESLDKGQSTVVLLLRDVLMMSIARSSIYIRIMILVMVQLFMSLKIKWWCWWMPGSTFDDITAHHKHLDKKFDESSINSGFYQSIMTVHSSIAKMKCSMIKGMISKLSKSQILWSNMGRDTGFQIHLIKAIHKNLTFDSSKI